MCAGLYGHPVLFSAKKMNFKYCFFLFLIHCTALVSQKYSVYAAVTKQLVYNHQVLVFAAPFYSSYCNKAILIRDLFFTLFTVSDFISTDDGHSQVRNVWQFFMLNKALLFLIKFSNQVKK